MSALLDKVLAERPENVIDFFEEFSRRLRERKFRAMTDHLKDVYVPALKYQYMMKLQPYLEVSTSFFLMSYFY